MLQSDLGLLLRAVAVVSDLDGNILQGFKLLSRKFSL
jgi:hypothetical protein